MAGAEYYNSSIKILRETLRADNYSPLINPAAGGSSPLLIVVSVVLIKLLELQNTGTLNVVAALNLLWTDQRLQWDSQAYGNVTSLEIPATQIWTPQLSLLNGVSENLNILINTNDTMALVSSSGAVLLNLNRQFKASCAVNLTEFPFDSQTCTLWFVSLSFLSGTVNFTVPPQSSGLDTSFYISTGEFTLADARLRAGSILQTSQKVFPSFNLTVTHRRNSNYYIINVAIPATLLLIASALVFLLPSDNGVKIGMACSLMVSLYVLQQAVSRMLPATPSTPLLAKGIAVALALALYALVCAVLNVMLLAAQPPLSPFLHNLVDTLERVFLCRFCRSSQAKKSCTDVSSALYDVPSQSPAKVDAYEDADSHDAKKNTKTNTNEWERLLLDKLDRLTLAIVLLSQSNKAQDERVACEEAERRRVRELARRWKVLDFAMNMIFLLVYVIVSIGLCVVYLFGTYQSLNY